MDCGLPLAQIVFCGNYGETLKLEPVFGGIQFRESAMI